MTNVPKTCPPGGRLQTGPGNPRQTFHKYRTGAEIVDCDWSTRCSTELPVVCRVVITATAEYAVQKGRNLNTDSAETGCGPSACSVCSEKISEPYRSMRLLVGKCVLVAGLQLIRAVRVLVRNSHVSGNRCGQQQRRCQARSFLPLRSSSSVQCRSVVQHCPGRASAGPVQTDRLEVFCVTRFPPSRFVHCTALQLSDGP